MENKNIERQILWNTTPYFKTRCDGQIDDSMLINKFFANLNNSMWPNESKNKTLLQLWEDFDNVENANTEFLSDCLVDSTINRLRESHKRIEKHNLTSPCHDHLLREFPAAKLIVDRLERLEKKQDLHNQTSVTKTDLEEHDSSVKKEIKQKKDELELAISEFRNHLSLFSVKKRMKRYTLFAVICFSIMTLTNVLGKEIIITLKWSCFALLLSIFFFIMASFIHESSNKEEVNV